MKPRSNSYSGATSSAAPPLSRPRKKVVVVLSPFIRAPTPKTSTATTAATTTAGNINIKEKGRDAQISINSAVASVGQQLLSPRSALKSSILDRLGPRVSHPISSTFPQTTSALNFENAPSFAHTTDPNPAPSMAQLRAKWRRKSPHQKSTTTSRNKPNRQKQESQSLTATPSKFAPRRRRRANSAKSKTALSLIREQNDALLQAAIMRAEEFAASLNSQGISADSQTDPHHQPLDLGRDEFRQLMRENGLRNHGFVTLITREDLIHGDDCSENGGSDDEYDNYDIFGGWQSDGSYEPSINDDDDNNDNDPVDGQEQTEQGQIKNSTSISSGGSRSSFDEGYDPENPEMQDHEEGDEDDSFDLGEIDSEIDAALTSMGITAGSISDMSMETRHQQLQLPQNQKEVLIQVFAEDGRPLGTPVIATRSLTGNEIVYSNFIDGTPATFSTSTTPVC
ncbi:hypothetical protein HK100_000812 [Physocladia obscura]|uniref:Uncharacterized protein n=1 Tax=Physocladia obscura TaxID=109957 RepID=A0AAD5XCB2_9FUNG|nr:hypothetical protein HK100_000812 [Physocladia obscura]